MLNFTGLYFPVIDSYPRFRLFGANVIYKTKPYLAYLKPIHNLCQSLTLLSRCKPITWTKASKSRVVPSLQWRHNEGGCVSNHRRLVCLFNSLFRRRSKRTSNLRVTGLCAGNSPVSGEFPAQRASNAENVFIWWRHHVYSAHLDPASSLHFVVFYCGLLHEN